MIDYIREGVLRGEFPPGRQLRELPLSRMLETSRGTVREALRTLQEEGLVRIVPHRGTVVAELSPKRVREVFELRALVESHAVELASDLVDDDALGGIRRAFEALGHEHGDAFEIIQPTWPFTVRWPAAHNTSCGSSTSTRCGSRGAKRSSTRSPIRRT